MASTTCLCSNVVNGVPARDLSSSGAFISGSPLSCCPPTSKCTPKLHTTKCSLSEKDQQASQCVGRRALAGVVATGAALAVFSNMAIAAQGPGNEGARRVAEKADKLLKAADKLNTEEAPPRFGPGRPGGAEDPTKISQTAGSANTSSVKGGITDAAKGAGDAARKVQNKSGGFFGFGKKQSNAATNNAKDTLAQAKGKSDEVVGSVRQAINRDGFGRFRGPKVEDAVGQVQDKKSQIANSAKDILGQAQKKSNLGDSGANVLSNLQEGFQGLKESAVQSSSDAKSTIQKGFK